MGVLLCCVGRAGCGVRGSAQPLSVGREQSGARQHKFPRRFLLSLPAGFHSDEESAFYQPVLRAGAFL